MITKRLKKSGELLGIRVLDHIILGEGESYYSIQENGAYIGDLKSTTRKLNILVR